MKNKYILALAVTAALISNFALGVTSAASITTSDQALIGGSLAIVSFPSSTNFSNVSISTSSQTNTLTFPQNSIHIRETRSTNNPFTFYITATDMQETSNLKTFDVTNISMTGDAEDSANPVGSSDCSSGISMTVNPQPFTDSNDDGIANPLTPIWGDSRIRVMECQINPVIDLIIPGSTDAGIYRTTFTWSIA
jgi:hypothetical protein